MSSFQKPSSFSLQATRNKTVALLSRAQLLYLLAHNNKYSAGNLICKHLEKNLGFISFFSDTIFIKIPAIFLRVFRADRLIRVAKMTLQKKNLLDDPYCPIIQLAENLYFKEN